MAHFFAWTKLPLATVTAFIFTQALFTLLFAVMIVGARVRLRRWIATAIGFFGVFVIVRPGFAAFQPAAFFALFAGAAIALQLVLVARLPIGEKELTMLFYLGAVGTAMTIGPGLAMWHRPTAMQAELLLANGVFGVAAQACVFRAFRIGEAAYVAPFDYFKLIVAATFGFFIFGEVPTIWTLAGAALIVASTVYISCEEYSAGPARVVSRP